jgi:hypothetical protein
MKALEKLKKKLEEIEIKKLEKETKNEPDIF